MKKQLAILLALLCVHVPMFGAIQTLKGFAQWPTVESTPHSVHSTAFVLDAANEAAAHVFFAPETGNISKMYYGTRVVTTGATIDIRLETVDSTTGFPTGTLQGTTTNCSSVVADADDQVWKNCTLTTVAAVTAGDLLAFVVQGPSSSFGNWQVGGWSFQPGQPAFPYSLLKSGAGPTWAKNSAAVITVGIEYSNGNKYNLSYAPWVLTTAETWQDATNPDERGNIFQIPFKAQVCGVQVPATALSAGATFTASLFDSNGTTVMSSQAVDADNLGTTGNQIARIRFPAVSTLLPNISYRIALRATNATTIGLNLHTAIANADLAFSPGGITMYKTTRDGGSGSWTDTNTSQYALYLLICGLDDGAGAGGSYTFVQ